MNNFVFRFVVDGVNSRDLSEKPMEIGVTGGVVGDLEERHEDVVQDLVKVLDASLCSVDIAVIPRIIGKNRQTD